jgi:hypothetical protein
VHAATGDDAGMLAEATLRPTADGAAADDVATAGRDSPTVSRQRCLGNIAGSSTGCEDSSVGSPMSSLIAAVLGSGPRATAMQAAHQQRVQQQHAQQQHQLLQQQLADELQPEMYQDLSQQLDQMLGLAAPAPGTAAAAAADGGGRVRSPSRARQDAASLIGRTGVRSGALATQHSGSSSCSSTGPATPKQLQQNRLAAAQQQQDDNSSSKCLRCGSDDARSPGRCCFHPGLVPVPGPLMYSPEWHACRAACTPDTPGCYSRREHYYLPSFSTSKPAAAGVGRSRLGAALQPGSPSKAHTAQQQRSGQGGRSNVSSGNMRVAANGRQSAEQHAGELQPRSVLPRPITPKSALRGSRQAL